MVSRWSARRGRGECAPQQSVQGSAPLCCAHFERFNKQSPPREGSSATLYIYRPAATPKVQRLVKYYYPPRHFNHSVFAPSLLFGYNLTV